MRLQNIQILLIILLVIGGVFYFVNIPEVPEAQEPEQFVWMIEMEDIVHITIDLPRENMGQSFIKISEEDVFPWYFDDEERTPVDRQRFGGGIPLLLSGPAAGRIIAEDTSIDKLTEFGLTDPLMQITLTLEDGYVMHIDVGDATPNGLYHYVRAPNSDDVALVDYTWYDVLERLILEPPYVSDTEE